MALLLQSRDYSFDRLVKFRHLYGLLVLTCRQQRSFIDDIGEIRADEAWSFCCHCGEIQIRREFHFLRVQLEDFRASLDIGTIHQDLPIESARRNSAASKISGRLV